MTFGPDPLGRLLDLQHKYSEALLVYERLGVDVARSALNASMYLNGGGLIAIPAAVALFRADVSTTRCWMIGAAACFVLGLFLATMAYAFAFYALARRGEWNFLIANRMGQFADATAKTISEEDRNKALRTAEEFEAQAEGKHPQSNCLRQAGVALFWISLILFLIGCGLGLRAVLQ